MSRRAHYAIPDIDPGTISDVALAQSVFVAAKGHADAAAASESAAAASETAAAASEAAAAVSETAAAASESASATSATAAASSATAAAASATAAATSETNAAATLASALPKAGTSDANSLLTMGTASLSGIGSAVIIARTITTGTDNHCVTDASVFNPGGAGNAYAAFDALFQSGGAANYDHLYGFQARQQHASSGTLNTLAGFTSAPRNLGGNVGALKHFNAVNGSHTGTITDQYGVYVGALTGATNNWGVVVASNNPSSFGGDVTMARAATVGLTFGVTGQSTFTGNIGVGGAASNTAGITVSSAALTSATQRGINSAPVFGTAATTTMAAIAAQVQSAAGSYTTASGYAFHAINPSLGAGHTLTTAVGVQVDNITAGATNYAIRTSGTAQSLFGGAVTVTGALAASAAATVGTTLSVTGTSTLTGNVGVGGASATTAGLNVVSAALASATQRGINVAAVFGAAATSTMVGIDTQIKSADGSYTTALGYPLRVLNPSLGSGHTLTTLIGLQIDSLTAATTNVAIRVSGTNECRFGGSIGVGKTTAPGFTIDAAGPIALIPGASVTPTVNGQVVIELTNNTTLTFKAKGSDGTVRSATLTLA